MFRLPEHQAIINRMGFNNPGVNKGVANISASTSFKGIIGVNIGKNKDTPNQQATEDYLIGLKKAYDVADYIAVNISSPNTPGLRDLQNVEETKRLLSALKKEQFQLQKKHGKQVPIALKVAPDLVDEQITKLSQVFKDEGLECLIATNTTISREEVMAHASSAESGGLSGAPVTAKSTEIIRKFHGELGAQIPIIGVGGIMSGDHAAEKIQAGATLVQLYTGFIYRGPSLIKECLQAMLR